MHRCHVAPAASARRQRGITLIELMIVVVIVGILTAIAVPAYRQYVLRAGRGEARAFLLDAAARQERFFSNNNTYADDLANLNYGSSTPASENGLYQLSVDTTAAAPAAVDFTITATAIGTQTQDRACATLTITNDGTRGATDIGGADARDVCWE